MGIDHRMAQARNLARQLKGRPKPPFHLLSAAGFMLQSAMSAVRR